MPACLCACEAESRGIGSFGLQAGLRASGDAPSCGSSRIEREALNTYSLC